MDTTERLKKIHTKAADFLGVMPGVMSRDSVYDLLHTILDLAAHCPAYNCGLPLEKVSCPVCGKPYGLGGSGVCKHCKECEDCCCCEDCDIISAKDTITHIKASASPD